MRQARPVLMSFSSVSGGPPGGRQHFWEEMVGSAVFKSEEKGGVREAWRGREGRDGLTKRGREREKGRRTVVYSALFTVQSASTEVPFTQRTGILLHLMATHLNKKKWSI